MQFVSLQDQMEQGSKWKDFHTTGQANSSEDPQQDFQQNLTACARSLVEFQQCTQLQRKEGDEEEESSGIDGTLGQVNFLGNHGRYSFEIDTYPGLI